MQYKKKPVVIDAVSWYGKYTDAGEWPDWFNEALNARTMGINQDDSLWVNTTEGIMRANIGDMVIRGVKHELYPCKPDVFALTYDAVEASGN